ncbi:AurF N-oxygenase family protein [Skermania piniformis]|uniref:Diiron oxygenase n=1 Tax=Skermania pinensis TaxID=39122 RepID=A0ABX8S938_9ACTN|nr:diiron oxygenase [Skermania piniformis]QXQ14332.1 diiron oxygenase [Skermania piniformis]
MTTATYSGALHSAVRTDDEWAARLATARDRSDTGERLLASAVKKSMDPTVDIDWAAPIPEDLYGMTPEWCSLYGTDLWERMTEEQRIILTKHEAASIAGTGLWFEAILMQMILRDIYDQDAADPHVQFALTEIADECRHSVMFAQAQRRFGIPVYRPRWYVHNLARVFKAIASGSLAYAGTLFAEEVLDMMQRDFMKDERVQPITRSVSRIHVLEEARHIRFAREECVRCLEDSSWARRQVVSLVLGVTAYFIITSLVNDDVYAAAGLDVAEAKRARRSNEHYHRMLRTGCGRTVEFLDSVGLLAAPARFLLRRAHAI